jgi:uncharacterized damage-inducible protein DinB
MKTYFLRLFDYDRCANEVMISLINKANNPEASVKLMAHLLASQQVWFYRCAGSTGAAPNIWPEGNPDNFAEVVKNSNLSWVELLNKLENDEFDKQIDYKNSRGDAFSNQLVDILGHVINHSTHHRAQIGQQLKAGGANLPFTDYIIYIRSLNS